jgi:murein DD-endopeptidase MepM/ murein hydrolase activator NlpD
MPPPLTREQLRSRRAWQRHNERQRNRRVLISAGLPAAIAGLAVLVLWLGTGGLSSDAAAPRATTPATKPISPGTRPPDIPIAKVGLVSLRLPVVRNQLTAIAFHPVDNPQAVEMDSAGSLDHHQSPRNGRPGPERGAVDVGAAAGTPVYSPVDGTVAGSPSTPSRPTATRS